ncbi:fumarylacetoacetate hydrolase domain-containing protein 2A [Ischnura elegans]|uniref:fumarylacetoacetate hydrolase domain-containing protein 2A n=1 Tax=Ischnura elegans TaxID=197161 RepID=UPI001ED88143|nr:fumarylacetoacetate hydrolase domain-containing protein 2A [Ischnura elegans]
MRFIQFSCDAKTASKLGIQYGNQVMDLSSGDAAFPNNLLDFLRGGESMIEAAKRAMTTGKKTMYDLSEVTIKAPITGQDKLVCVGMNYRDHCEELNAPIPEEPVIFNKFPSTIIGPFDPIPFPSQSKAVDWEVELAVVIAKKGKNIPVESAMDYIFGYSVAHDITARDLLVNRNGGQWLLGKSMDGFCPLGPCVVTRDEIADPHSLPLCLSINGVVKQNGNTSKMIYRLDAIISHISRFFTLLPGDVILTGTPPGVGHFRKPPEYLKVGDEVECVIEGIGKIKNKVIG